MTALTTQDIEKLIEACKNGGVSKLKFEKLELSFHAPADSRPLANAIASTSPAKSIETIIDEDQDLRELLLENIAISDPLAYEQMREDRG